MSRLRLNIPLSLEQPTRVPDGAGGPVTSWTLLFSREWTQCECLFGADSMWG